MTASDYSGTTITVAIVEDAPRFSTSIAAALGASAMLQCVGVCQSADEALGRLPEWKPDVALLDLDIGPGRSGLDILPELVRQSPGTLFLILTVIEDPESMFQALLRGAVGYLAMSTPIAELPAAILEVYQGFLRLSPEVLRRMFAAFQNPEPSAPELERLSPGEAELLELLAQGYDRKELAQRVELSPETLKTHMRNIHHKLRVSTTRQAFLKVYPRRRLQVFPSRFNTHDPL